jgi:hypothetical protein
MKLQLEPARIYQAIERGIYRAFRDAMAAGDIATPAAGEQDPPTRPGPSFNNDIDVD